MSYLLGLAVAAAATRKRHHSCHKKSHSVGKNSGHSYVGSYSDENWKYDFNHCIVREIKQGDSVLSKFFTLLNDEYYGEIEKLRKENNTKMEELKSVAPDDKLNILIKLFQQRGIDFKYYYNRQYIQISINNSKRQFTLYNVEGLIKDINDSIKHSKESINTFQEIINKEKAKIEYYKRKKKFSIIHRAEYKEEISKSSTRVSQCERWTSERLEEIKALESFVALDEEEKNLLESSIDESEKHFKEQEELKRLEENERCLKCNIDRDLIKRIVERLIEEGKITTDEYKEVFTELKKVEKIARKEGIYCSMSTDEKMLQIIRWFVHDNYFGINNNLLEENIEENQEQAVTKKLVPTQENQ